VFQDFLWFVVDTLLVCAQVCSQLRLHQVQNHDSHRELQLLYGSHCIKKIYLKRKNIKHRKNNWKEEHRHTVCIRVQRLRSQQPPRWEPLHPPLMETRAEMRARVGEAKAAGRTPPTLSQIQCKCAEPPQNPRWEFWDNVAKNVSTKCDGHSS
jgi:hypothetical protein